MSLNERLKTVLALIVTAAAVWIGVLNLHQRFSHPLYDQGIIWTPAAEGLIAEEISQSPLANPQGASVEPGDRLLTIDGIPVEDLNDYYRVASHLEQTPGRTVQYRVAKAASGAEVVLEAPVRLSLSLRPIDYALPFLALGFLALGGFVYLRNWRARGAFHFYAICLTFFVLLLYRISGSGDILDQIVLWADVTAFLLAGPLLLHFAAVFPQPLPLLERLPRLKGMIYLPFALLAFLYALWFRGLLQPFGMPRTFEGADLWDLVHLVHLLALVGLSAWVLLSVQRAQAGVRQRQQIQWITAGVFFGGLPVLLLYLPNVLWGSRFGGLLDFSVLSLLLIPLGFAYAITRYRLMDVDVIFKRGAVYALTSAALLGLYLAVVLGLGRLVQGLYTSDESFTVFAASALVLGFVFAPLRNWVQGFLDRRFYKDEYAYRASFAEFERTLGSETRLSELTHKICQRVEAALSISPVTIFLRDDDEPGVFHLYRSAGRFSLAQEDGRVTLPEQLLNASEATHIPVEGEGGAGLSHMIFGDWGIEYVQPLRVRGRVIGFMGLGRRQDGHALSSEDLSMVSTLAGYAAIAVDNAILYDSLESKAGQLNRLKAYSENVVESITVGVAVLSPEGRVTVWNNAMQRLYGLSRQDAEGRDFEDLMPDSVVEAVQNMLDGPGWSVESTRNLHKTRLKNRQGEEHLTNITLTPFVAQQGLDSGLLVLFEDITEKTQLQDQLLQAEKLSSIGLFAAGVAHEVNTPLAGISSYAQMLLNKTSPQDPAYETLKKIESQSFRASEIINNLLNFARVSDSDGGEVNLNSLMVETVSLLEPQFKKGNVEVDVDLDPYLPKTVGVGGKLQQVFMNLFMNARDAMPEGGDLRIRTFRKDGQAVIEVEDSGSGISPDDLKRIYDPFFTTKEVGKGTGLGLSVSYGIVQEHQGRISVESRPGQGTTFQVRLPIKRLN
ncbi:MAG TPA: ATP-binding protein [Acidobacteriota bacterium]|nr:ATP-binding protein [Acidobacteriota bacterium]